MGDRVNRKKRICYCVPLECERDDTALGAERPRLRPCAGLPSLSTPVRTDGARCGASKTPPPIDARPSFERPPGAPRGLLMAVLKGASTGLGWGAGCPGCGRVLQPPGRGSAPQNCPPAAYSTASQPLPPPQGLYCGHISPPPTGSRAGARRARLGARTARKVQRVLPPGRLKAAGRQYSPRNARTGCSGCCAGGRCVGRCCAGRQAVRPPAAAAPAPSLAGAVAPRAPNSAGTRHASSLSRGEQAVQRAKRARSRTFKAGSGHSKGIPLRIPSVPPS